MIKSLVKLEYKVGEREYCFLCDNNSPFGEVHDALSQFKAYALDQMSKAQEVEAAKKANLE